MTERNNTGPQDIGGQPPQGLRKIMAGQMNVYYSNCAMVATTHRELSLFFGRLVPVGDPSRVSQLAELYEKHIYLTLEQAEDLVRVMNQTIQAFKAGREAARAASEQAMPRPVGPVT